MSAYAGDDVRGSSSARCGHGDELPQPGLSGERSPPPPTSSPAGRIQMGIGGGWYEHEWRAYGYGFPSAGVRLGRLDEGVQIMRDAWRDGEVSFDGKALFRSTVAIVEPKPLQDGGIPLWIAGGGEESDAAHRRQVRPSTPTSPPEPEGFATQVAGAGRSLPRCRQPTYGAIRAVGQLQPP